MIFSIRSPLRTLFFIYTAILLKIFQIHLNRSCFSHFFQSNFQFPQESCSNRTKLFANLNSSTSSKYQNWNKWTHFCVTQTFYYKQKCFSSFIWVHPVCSSILNKMKMCKFFTENFIQRLKLNCVCLVYTVDLFECINVL